MSSNPLNLDPSLLVNPLTVKTSTPYVLNTQLQAILPSYISSTHFPPPIVGGMLFNIADGYVYVSNGRSWTTGTVAPVVAGYITVTPEGALVNSEVLTAGTGIVLTDGGPGATITISTKYSPNTDQYILASSSAGDPPASRVIEAGTNISLTPGTHTLTIAFTGTIPSTTAPYILQSSNPSLPDAWVIESGTGITLTPSTGALTVSTGAVTTISAEYITTTTDSNLTAYRYLVAGTSINISTSSSVTTISTSTSPVSNLAPFVLMNTTLALTQARTLTAGTNISLTDGGAGGNATISLNQPMNTKGDLLYYSGGLDKLSIGSSGNVLRATSSLPTWGQYVNPSTETFFVDDFLSYSVVYDRYWNEVTTGLLLGTYSQSFGAPWPFGAGEINSTVASTSLALIKYTSTIVPGTGAALFEAGINISTLPGGTDNAVIQVGLADTATTGTPNSNNAIKFMSYATTSTTNWTIATIKGGTATYVDSGTAINTSTWVRLMFMINAAGTSVSFYVGGIQCPGSPITTNIPTVGMSPTFAHVRLTAGTGADIMSYIDYIYYYQLFNGVGTSRY